MLRNLTFETQQLTPNNALHLPPELDVSLAL